MLRVGRRDGRRRRRARADQAARRAPGARGGDRRALPAPDRRRARGRLPRGALADRGARAWRRGPRCSPATTSRAAGPCDAARGLGPAGARRRARSRSSRAGATAATCSMPRMPWSPPRRGGADVPRRAAGPPTRVRFWCGTNERAEAQAVARDIEARARGGRGEDGADLRGGASGRRPRPGDRRSARGAARALPAHRARAPSSSAPRSAT